MTHRNLTCTYKYRVSKAAARIMRRPDGGAPGRPSPGFMRTGRGQGGGERNQGGNRAAKQAADEPAAPGASTIGSLRGAALSDSGMGVRSCRGARARRADCRLGLLWGSIFGELS